MHRILGFAIVFASAIASAQTDDPARDASPSKLWGEFIDPDGDSNIRHDGEAVVISVNSTPHDLSIELGRMNAPRVLLSVTGDFIAQVKLVGSLNPEQPTIPERVAFQSSGLLLYQNDRNYIRFERAAIRRDGEIHRYLNFESRENGEPLPSQNAGLPDERDLWLRLERRGKKMSASVSADGDRWVPLPPMSADLSRTVRIGIAAVNATDQGFEPRYEDFRLFVDETEGVKSEDTSKEPAQ
jgi:regulation of enolase protein 1 (concanavalin A-like superfamily)